MKSAINTPLDDNEEGMNPLETMMRLSANYLRRESDPLAFLNWFTQYMPMMCNFFEHLNASQSRTAQDTKAMWRGLGRLIYSQLPIASNDYRLKKISEPGRNEPCDCGSGDKYKNCCADGNKLASGMPMINGLRYVLDDLNQSTLGEIAGTHADLNAVVATAHDWTNEGLAKRSVALLEPYFKGETPLSAKLDLLFEELMSALYEMDKPRKRENLIKQVLLRGDKALQSSALQRRATIRSDEGLYDEAWMDFKAAFTLNPNDPSLSHLEVLILTSQGKLDQAKVRAQYWVKSLKALRDTRYGDLIAYLEKSAADPIAAGLHAARGMYPFLDELCTLMEQAPSPQSHYSGELQSPHHARFGGQGVGTLSATPSMTALQQQWRDAFHQVKPVSTYVQNDAPQVWDNAAVWLKLLKREPQLWNCFDVIDDLVMATECLPLGGVIERVMMPLGERAAELLQLTLEKLTDNPVQLMALRCEWIVGDNRPALRPIAHLAFACKAFGKKDRYMNLAHWFVFGLNPNDNHGFRDDLSNALISEDRNEEVLQLCETYPEDGANLELNGVLALRCLGRKEDAAKALKLAVEHHPNTVKMLLKDKVKPVKSDAYGIQIGGNYQAWLYYEAMREEWLIAGAIAWAKTVLK